MEKEKETEEEEEEEEREKASDQSTFRKATILKNESKAPPPLVIKIPRLHTQEQNHTITSCFAYS